jgi:hypothetical protein
MIEVPNPIATFTDSTINRIAESPYPHWGRTDIIRVLGEDLLFVDTEKEVVWIRIGGFYQQSTTAGEKLGQWIINPNIRSINIPACEGSRFLIARFFMRKRMNEDVAKMYVA